VKNLGKFLREYNRKKSDHLIFLAKDMRVKSFLLVLILTLGMVGKAYAVISNIYSDVYKEDYSICTDDHLRELAVQKGILPENITQEYINKNLQEKNSIIIWLIIEREKKVKAINKLKDAWRDEEKAIVRNPSECYVDKINNVLYECLLNDDDDIFILKKGIGMLFKTIVIMEGDYDDGSGRSKVEILKDYLGEERFEWYKRKHPNKLKYLEELDKYIKGVYK